MNKTDKFGFVSILVTIVMANIFIGSNIKEPIWIMQFFMSIVSIIYIVIKKVQKEKNVIIKSKIDICVLVFMISTMIPLIAKTYVSLNGTINFILKYWSVYGIYIIARNTITQKKQINIFIKTLIISSIIPIILGYDKLLNINLFENIFDKIDSVKLTDSRMISIFGYANTFAIYLAIIDFLTISMYKQEQKKFLKVLYLLHIIIITITLGLTTSKAVIALCSLIVLIYVILRIRNKTISKKWIVIGILGIILFFIYFFIAIQIPKDLVVTESQKNCIVRMFEKNAKYKLDFNIDAKSDQDYDSFKIIIVEITKYSSEKQLGILSFAKYNGWKSVEIQTDELLSHLEVRIMNPLNQEITIKDFKINDKPYILEYKIIPEPLVRMFVTFNFKYTGAYQRLDFWQDGIKIAKKHWLFGAGGNTWRMLYGQVQSYLYYAKEVHSYILEIIMSFGIIGILSYICIVCITLKNGFKLKNNKTILPLFIGFVMIFLHSMMDFDMSYLIMIILYFLFISIINIEDKKINKNTNIIECILIFIFSIITIGNICGTITSFNNGNINIAPWIEQYQFNDIVCKNMSNEQKIEKIKQYIKNEPYSQQNSIYEIWGNLLLELDETEKKKNIDLLIQVLKNVTPERLYNIVQTQKRTDIIMNIYEKSGQEPKGLLEIVVSEYKDTAFRIIEYDKNLMGKVASEMTLENYKDTYEKALKLLRNSIDNNDLK